jgi:hypothetical protein
MRNGNTRPGHATRRAAPGSAGAAAICVVTALLGACATLERNPNVVGTYSDKLSPFNYKEDGRLVSMVVGVDAARFIRKEAYVPLFVQVANKTKQTLSITRESFVLEDSLGRQYPLAPAQELAEKYPRLDIDRRLFNQNRSVTATGVGVFTYIGSNFFPSASRRALLIQQVTLPPVAFMEDVLYFPIPETGLNGVPLRLLFKVKELEEPIQVVFEVPKTIGIFEKEKGDR